MVSDIEYHTVIRQENVVALLNILFSRSLQGGHASATLQPRGPSLFPRVVRRSAFCRSGFPWR